MRRGVGANGRRLAALVTGVMAAGALAALCSAGTTASPSAQSRSLRAQQTGLRRAEQAAVLDLYALESSIARARARLSVLEARASRLSRERELTRRRTAAVRSSLATARRQLAQTLRALYMRGQPDPIAILLGAGSIDEAMAGIDGLRQVALGNRRLIADLRRREARYRLLTAQLQARTRALASARLDAERGLAELTSARSAKVATIASLRHRRTLTAAQITRLDAVARGAQRRSATLTAKITRPAPAPAQTTTTTPAGPPTAAGAGTYRLVVDAVAYHLPGHTASGLPVGVGVVAVDPVVIPLGTRMFVPGYGPAVAADVGTAVKGRIIDLWMPTRAQALAWGRRTVTITIYG